MKLGTRNILTLITITMGVVTVFGESRAEFPSLTLLVSGILLIVSGLALRFVWLRCPNCSKPVGWDGGAYCTHCGAKIDWSAK